MGTAVRILILLIGLGGPLYWLVIRRWMGTWGATDAEISKPLPGDDLVPNAHSVVTHAITINAPPSAVWPWLLQLGQERGGFYSYQRLENLIGCDIHNVYAIDPALQIRETGERVSLGAPEGFPHYIVNAIANEHALVLYGEDPALRTTWQFVVEHAGTNETRLLVRSRFHRSPGFGAWLAYAVVVPPAHFIMEHRMMLTIKRLAESTRTPLPA